MTNMYFNRDKQNLWILCLGIMITGFIVSNMEAERILKQPFRNSLNDLEESFNSPASMIFFTSGFIWIACVILNFIERRRQNTKSENQWQSLEGIGKCSISKIQSSIIEQRKVQNSSQYSHHQENQHLPLQQQLSLYQSIKLFVPAFLQTYFFLSSLTHLSYPKVLVFKLLSSLGLVHLYSSLFTETQNKLSKFMLSIITFVGFGIFNYFFVDTEEQQIEQKLYKKDVVQGYMWVIAMGYMGLLRKILDQKVEKQRKQSRQGIVSTLEMLKIQAKIHCILAYLLAICLKQEIYAPVFAILHNGVFSNFLLFILALFLSKFMKVYTQTHFTAALTKFLLILQKNASLIISIIYFGQGINSGQLFGLSLISLMGYFKFQSDRNNKQN